MKLEDLVRMILPILPNAVVMEDLETNEVVIHTGLTSKPSQNQPLGLCHELVSIDEI